MADEAPTTETTTLDLRRPDVPTTIEQLAARKGEAVEIIEARGLILSTARLLGIKHTHPEDWVLYKAPEDAGGQVVAYLQDAGCDRVRDIFGIEVFDVSRPEKIAGTEAGVFHYVISGSGRCRLTLQVVEAMEGGRSSTDDFCKDKTGAELELAVRKAARANLDGNITRELAGLKSVPVGELARAWEGTAKKVEACRKGRGFGTRDERLGGKPVTGPDVEPPVCPHCKATGIYRPAKGTRGAFYGCPNYQKHPQQKWVVDAAKWSDQAKTSQPPVDSKQPTADERLCDACGKRKVDHATADHDFVPRGREPGEEG